MTPEQITQLIQDGRWVSITTELRPSSNTSATGKSSRFIAQEFLPILPVTDLPVP